MQGGKDLVRIQLGQRMHINRAALKQLLHLTVCSDEHSNCEIVCFFTVTTLNPLKEEFMPGNFSIRELQACYYYSNSEFQGKTATEKKPFMIAHSAISSL